MSKVPKLPFDVGFRIGTSDGQAQRPLKCRPSLIKALISDQYREEYSRGYRAGYFEAARAARRKDLKQTRLWERGRER